MLEVGSIQIKNTKNILVRARAQHGFECPAAY